MAMATKTVAQLTAIVLLISSAASDTPATKYTNHTVGGLAGWFFNLTTNTTSANYSSWAATQTFNLGDYLIFNTNTNETVIQTYDPATYSSCSTDNASDNDTFQFDGGNTQFNQPMIVLVPLTIVGNQYYFSDADDGIPCQQGMGFQINVGHGLGLPPSLNQPPPPSYVPPPLALVEAPPSTILNPQKSGSVVRREKVWWCLVSLACGAFGLIFFG